MGYKLISAIIQFDELQNICAQDNASLSLKPHSHSLNTVSDPVHVGLALHWNPSRKYRSIQLNS